MSVTKEQMGELTSLVNKSQGIPDPADQQQQQQQSVDDNKNIDNSDAGADDGDTFVNEANEPVNKDGERINDQGQLIDDDDNVIDASADGDDDNAGGDDAGGDDSTYTPKELAEAIGWDTEDLYNSVMIPMDDGQPAVSLGDFKNTHQNLVRDHELLKTQMTDQAGQLQQAQTGFAQGQQMSSEMMEAQSYLMQVNRMEQETDWKELEEDDPTQAVLKRQQIQKARDDIGQEMNRIGQQQQQAHNVMLQQAGVKMVELIPTWSDDKVRQTDMDNIRTSVMHKAGFSDAEVDTIVDPRTMMLLKELHELRALKASANKAVKKVRKAPKVLAGNRGVRRAKAGEQTKTLVKQAHKTGNKGDQMNAVKSILAQSKKP
jgi:hypothetical protein